MKTILSIFAILTIFTKCQSQEDKATGEDITVVYEAITRGQRKVITITKAASHLKNNTHSTEIKTDTKHWNALLEAIKSLDLDGLPNLKAPTSKRLFDGALAATITITKGEKNITSSSFDEGFPPEELEKITTQISSIEKTLSEK